MPCNTRSSPAKARVITVVVTLIPLFVATHAAGSDQMILGGAAIVDSIVDPETLRLRDGRLVRLAGIDVPKFALDFDPQWALPAIRLLEELAKGRQVDLLRDERKFDRYGRVIAHVRLAAGDGGPDDWLQGALLARGLARVRNLPGNMAMAEEMLRIERVARVAALGLWSNPAYRVRTPADLDDAVGRFQIVEGLVMDASFVGGRGYLNFGTDYETDFTVTFEGRVRTLFEQVGVDPLALKGRRIRARGWLEFLNGPMIEISHPGQIEVVQ